MARQVESSKSLKIKNALRARGHYVVKNHGDRFTEPGISDLTGTRFGDGISIAIETKEKTKLSPAQAEFLAKLDEISHHHARTGVAHSVRDAILIVEDPDWLARYHLARNRYLRTNGKKEAINPLEESIDEPSE